MCYYLLQVIASRQGSRFTQAEEKVQNIEEEELLIEHGDDEEDEIIRMKQHMY